MELPSLRLTRQVMNVVGEGQEAIKEVGGCVGLVSITWRNTAK